MPASITAAAVASCGGGADSGPATGGTAVSSATDGCGCGGGGADLVATAAATGAGCVDGPARSMMALACAVLMGQGTFRHGTNQHFSFDSFNKSFLESFQKVCFEIDRA